jgi:hypothetical protein
MSVPMMKSKHLRNEGFVGTPVCCSQYIAPYPAGNHWHLAATRILAGRESIPQLEKFAHVG